MSEVFDYAEFYNEAKIPSITMTGLVNFVHKGVMPGSFLCAALENKLKQTYGNASDESNLVAIPAIVQYLYNSCPGIAWGDAKAVREWTEIGGLEGYSKGARPKADTEEDEDETG